MSCIYRAILPVKHVHISFDDVSLEKTSGIDDFIQRLRRFHSLYGAKFSLYTFDLNEKIKRDSLIVETFDWLKFSYHGSSEPFDTLLSRNNYVKNLDYQLYLLRQMGGDSCLSNTVRLHYFFADSVMINKASSNGINTFLAADSPGRISYSLDSCDNMLLYDKGYLVKGDNKYYRTDIRLENTKLWDCITHGNLSDNTLVIFTHVAKFGRIAEFKMHILMFFLWLNHYEFVTDL